MKIGSIDNNFSVHTDITEPGIVWLNVRQMPFALHGIQYDEKIGCYTRMPQSIAAKISEGVELLNCNTAGGRVRFCTDSRFIGIHAVMDNAIPMSHMPLAGQSGFDLYRRKRDERTEQFYHTFIPPVGIQKGYSSAFNTDGALADHTIYFPLYDGVRELYIAIKKDAMILAPTPYSEKSPIVYYGSSITQGGCASHPGNSYQAMISRKLDRDYINLGFSGNCKGENEMIQYLANLKMSIFVCDYDHNAPDAEHLKKTHLQIYRGIRKKQSDLPLIFVSAPTILLEPDQYEIRREVIRATYQTALAEGDRKVYFIDGAELFEGDNWDCCTVDGVHPNDLGFYRIAKRIEKEIILIK